MDVWIARISPQKFANTSDNLSLQMDDHVSSTTILACRVLKMLWMHWFANYSQNCLIQIGPRNCDGNSVWLFALKCNEICTEIITSFDAWDAVCLVHLVRSPVPHESQGKFIWCAKSTSHSWYTLRCWGLQKKLPATKSEMPKRRFGYNDNA